VVRAAAHEKEGGSPAALALRDQGKAAGSPTPTRRYEMIMQTKQCPVCQEPPEELIVSKSEYLRWTDLGKLIGTKITPSEALAKSFPNMQKDLRRRVWDGMCWQCVK
jgi:hypothetical protein